MMSRRDMLLQFFKLELTVVCYRTRLEYCKQQVTGKCLSTLLIMLLLTLGSTAASVLFASITRKLLRQRYMTLGCMIREIFTSCPGMKRAKWFDGRIERARSPILLGEPKIWTRRIPKENSLFKMRVCADIASTEQVPVNRCVLALSRNLGFMPCVVYILMSIVVLFRGTEAINGFPQS
jgi:hypothetical protein